MTTTLTEKPVDTTRMWNRTAGFAGIASVVLLLALTLGISASAPVFTGGADELRSWFADNEGPVAFWDFIAPLTFGILQLVYAIGLLRRLAEDDTTGGNPSGRAGRCSDHPVGARLRRLLRPHAVDDRHVRDPRIGPDAPDPCNAVLVGRPRLRRWRGLDDRRDVVVQRRSCWLVTVTTAAFSEWALVL